MSKPAQPDWKAHSIEALAQYFPLLCCTIERVNKTSTTFRCMAVNKETLRITCVSSHVANILGVKDSPPWGVNVSGWGGVKELKELLHAAIGNTTIDIYTP